MKRCSITSNNYPQITPITQRGILNMKELYERTFESDPQKLKRKKPCTGGIRDFTVSNSNLCNLRIEFPAAEGRDSFYLLA